jgi:gliding motility-associated-like protein
MARRIVLVSALLISYFNILATHIVGGELNYKCLGNNQYEIRLTVYRDCYNGVPPFDNPASVGIFDASNKLVTNLLIPFKSKTTLPPTMAQANVCVKTPSNVCVEVSEYVATVTLPPITGGYQLAYQRCCRNQTITNLTNPGNQGATYYAHIPDQSQAVCNSNPKFNNWPPIFICVNNPVIFDHSATDIDGDSIVYTLCSPFTGATGTNSEPQPPAAPPYTSVTFKAGYTPSNPMGGPNPLTINPSTGLITGVPPAIGQFVIGICADEYRNGKLISTTKRDFQFNVINCQPDVSVAVPNVTVNCGSRVATFSNTSLGATKFLWNFGDTLTLGDTSQTKNSTYTYPAYGTYGVTLVAYSNLSPKCNDTLFNYPVTVDSCAPCAMTLSTVKTDAICGAAGACTKTIPVLDTKNGKTITAGNPPADSTTMSWTHTVTAGGLNRLLVVQVSSITVSATSVTYAGMPLQSLGKSTTVTSPPNATAEMWYLLNPPTGANMVVVTFPNGSGTFNPEKRGESFSFTGVDQTTPFGPVTQTTGVACAAYKVVSGPNELILDQIVKDYFYALSPDASQTQQYSLKISFNPACAGSTKPGASVTDTMKWTWNFCVGGAGNGNQWAAVGVSIKPACSTAAICKHYTWTHPCGNYVFKNYGNSGQATGSCAGIGTPGNSVSNVTALPYAIVGTDTLPKGGTEVVVNNPATPIAACKGATITTDGTNIIFDFYVFISGGSGTGTPGSATVIPAAGSSPYSYSWSPSGGNGATANNLTAGTYTVSVIDGSGCLKTTAVIIDANSTLNLGAAFTNVTTCGAKDGTASVNPSGGIAPYTMSWSNGQTGVTAITGLGVGSITAFITDSAGCSKSNTFTFTAPVIITATTTETDVKCKPNNGTATAHPTSGTRPYTYKWTTSPVQTDSVATGLKPGYYIVTVTDANGCTGSSATSIADSSLTATSASTNIACAGGTSGTATVTPIHGTTTYSYSWNSTPVQTTATASGLTAGDYTVTVTDAANCTVSQTVSITEPSAIKPEPTNTSTINCAGVGNGSATVLVGGGSGSYTYSWCNGSTSPTVSGLPAGICVITVTDSLGCAKADSVNIVFPLPLTLSNQSISISCNGNVNGAATVSVLGGSPIYSYLWSTTPAKTNQTADSLAVGSYTVTVTDAQGCSATQTVTITEPSALSLAKTVTNAGCGVANGKARVVATGGTLNYRYSWSTSPVQTDSVAINLGPGTYIASVTDAHGCKDTVNVAIVGSATTAKADFKVDYALSCNDGIDATFTNNSTGATSYFWNFGDGTTSTLKDPVHKFTFSQTSTVTLIAIDNGCADTLQMVITTKAFNDYFRVPNVFTPNGDGKNDCFEVSALTYVIPCVQLTIYDRWGLKMYDNEHGACWDGKYNGKEVPDGTYFYLVKLGTTSHEAHGALTLLKYPN